MTQEQIAQIQTLTRFTADNFPGASFHNTMPVGSVTAVIDVYVENGLRYLGAYSVSRSGQFYWYGPGPWPSPAFISLDIP